MQLNNKVFLQELREQFLQKIIDDWQEKWQSEFKEFESFETIKNKNAFLELLLLDIENTLFKKLNGQRSKYLFSKDFLRRFIYEYGTKEARIQSHSRTGIAFYLGYDGWEDFVKKNKEIESQNIHINYIHVNESMLPVLLKNKLQIIDNQDFANFQELKSKRNHKKLLIPFLGIILLGTGSYFAFDWWKNRPFSETDLSKIKFEVIKTLGKYPQLVRVRYDVSSLPDVNSVEIETGLGRVITSTKFEANSIGSTNKIDTVGQTYFYPGVYYLVLIVNKKRVKDLVHVVYSKPDDWIVWAAGIAYGKDWTTDISSMEDYTKDGVFHFDPAKLPQEIKQDDDFRNVIHALTQDFHVAFDSLQIEARMKNPKNEGGEGCYDMQIIMTDKNFNSASAIFTTEGCTDYVKL